MLKKRILSIDYGLKKSGISITDYFKHYAIAHSCIKTKNLLKNLKEIINKEKIDVIVLGLPKKLNNKNQLLTNKVYKLQQILLKKYPKLIVDLIDERYTSKLALYYLNLIKYPKSKIKDQIHIMSAILILQSYLKNKKI
ncbi:MAG: Holliday junction resolvase RuvX [Candidatus Shikimatogenerans bostrichidophilus]|nr:MAG: Holliday junction resolvase RuvX [Candidatus Shikimatogenerans bostrichidophilus]